MGILKNKTGHFNASQPDSLVSLRKAVEVLSHDNEFTNEVLRCFSINPESPEQIKQPLRVGNVKQLLDALADLDDQDWKIDVPTELHSIDLEKVLENDYAQFHLYGIKNPDLVKAIRADHLQVESRYSARSDMLEYYNFSKFASFLHLHQMDPYAKSIWEHLQRTIGEEKRCSARLLYHKEEDKYYLRAVTSELGYKNYGINFSVLVALLAVDSYARSNNDIVFIDQYNVDDSTVDLSFQFSKQVSLGKGMSLSLNLLLNNDEIRQSSVAMNAMFKVQYDKDGNSLYLKPASYEVKPKQYVADMLTYTHAMKVSTVYKKIKTLPVLIEKYIQQVKDNADAILNIKDPQIIKDHLLRKVERARKEEFMGYKEAVIKKIISMEVKTVFDLFEVLRSVEELFGDDIRSRTFWRERLYETLINRGKND